METVSQELIKRVFSFINKTKKQADLLVEKNRWHRIIAALYALEDTSCAIRYYLDSDYPNGINGKYLFTYGLLQSLFVQGDAVESLMMALFNKSIDMKKQYPSAYKVREIRNDVVGHPTNRGGHSYIRLSQHSMNKQSFYYIKDSYDDSHIETINIIKSISDTAKCVNDVLTKGIEYLEKEFRDYIESHKDRKMVKPFEHLSYIKEKMLCPNELGEYGYDTTKKIIEETEKELGARYGSIKNHDACCYLIEDIKKIHSIIDTPSNESHSEWRQIRHFLFELLFYKLEQLKDCCEEIDEYFENYGEPQVAEPASDASVPVVFLDEDLLE